MNWILQRDSYSLGDFIELTPAIQGLAQAYGGSCPVFFETEEYKTLFSLPWIEILNQRPREKPINLTGHPARTLKESNYEAWWRTLSPLRGFVPKPAISFVGITHDELTAKVIKYRGERIALFNETLSSVQQQFILNKLLNSGAWIFLLGNAMNWEDIEVGNAIPMFDISLMQIAQVIRLCDKFVGDGSSLYHMGAALDKAGEVFWINKNDFVKHKAPVEGIIHHVI